MDLQPTAHPRHKEGTVITPQETRAVAITIGVALAVVLYMAYFFHKGGAPAWAYCAVVALALFVATVVIHYTILPGAEERAYRALAGSPSTRQAEARIIGVRHEAIKESERLRQTQLRITAAVPQDNGEDSRVELSVWIEDALLPNFASGKPLHLLYDPADPTRMAVDRRRSPLLVQ